MVFRTCITLSILAVVLLSMHVYEQISFGADMINIVRIVCNCIALLTMRLLPGISPQYGAKWVSYPDPFSRWCTDTAG